MLSGDRGAEAEYPRPRRGKAAMRTMKGIVPRRDVSLKGRKENRASTNSAKASCFMVALTPFSLMKLRLIKEQVLRIQKVIEGSPYEELIQQFCGWGWASFGALQIRYEFTLLFAWWYYVATGQAKNLTSNGLIIMSPEIT
ncbi:MAG: hypothetical protein DDT23_01254 [candidate division WS2 bacterium]|nr:hypothetical protein [Candidatus Lithacetigena glycinireducens]